MVGKSDQQFMDNAAQSSMMEIQLAQLAQQKAASSEVKEYARKLEQDHSKASDQLKKIAQERGVQLPSDMGKHQQQLAKFQNLSGEEFDRAYIKAQVQHHKKDISQFKKYQDRGMDTDVKEFAAAQLPVLQQHFDQAQQLSASTGTRSRKADSSSSSNSSSSSSSGSATTTGTSGNTNSTGTTGTSGNTNSRSNSDREGQTSKPNNQ
jgi:putative membrane protein